MAKTGWDSSLPTIKNENESGDRWDQFQLVHKTPKETIVYYECPNADCLMKEPSSAEAFRPDDLDTKLKCRRCRKTTYARNWKCGCNIPWYTCDTHQTFHCCNEVKKHKNQDEPKSSTFSRASYAKRKRQACEGNDDMKEDRQERVQKCTKTSALAKRKSEVELDQLESETKVARIYEKLLSRFRGRVGTSSCSS